MSIRRKVTINGMPALQETNPVVSDLSKYVVLAKDDLRRQMRFIEAQLSLLDSLKTKTTKQKVSLLYNLWDRNGDGTLQWSELALGLKKFGVGDIDDAAKLAAEVILAEDSDSKNMSREQFEVFLNTLCQGLGVKFDDIAEFLVLRYTAEDTEEEVVEMIALDILEGDVEEELAMAKKFESVLLDPPMIELFECFDRNNDEVIDFKELAQGLEKFEVPFDETIKAAISALLLFDDNESRGLDYVAFARFMLSFSAAVGAPFKTLAPTFLELCEADEDASEQGQKLQRIKSKALSDIQEEFNEEIDIVQTANDARCQALFTLADLDGDGRIDFKELALALKKYVPSNGVSETAAVAAAMLLAYDDDEDQKLDPVEFAHFLNKFCAIVGSNWHELADFLVVASLVNSSDSMDIAILNEIQPVVVQSKKA